MKRIRNVFLFGAGAIIDWKAPFTYELTDLIRTSGFFTTDNKTTITEFIYQHLRTSSNYTDKDINFETIINVVEELMAYYASFEPRQALPSLYSAFFVSQHENELLNFSIEGGEKKHGFKLEIPKGKRSEFAKSAYNDETPAQFFFQQLLAELLTNIIARVSKYAYHTKGFSKVITEENKEMNLLFDVWMHKIAQTGILRMYSLNYDKNFKIILERSNNPIPVFEGFDHSEMLEPSSNLLADIPKIITDTDSNIYYNLHGSAFWNVEARNSSQLPNPIFYLTEVPVLPVNSYEQSIWQSEKGKTIMLTNIITGYQKTQRGIFSPFKQMQAALDRDCCFADNIYVIGYSFGDEHINASLRTAIQHNENAKFIIIEPSFTKNDFDFNVMTKVFSSAGNSNKMKPKTIKEKFHSFFDGKFLVHEKTFKEYLMS